MGTNARCPFYRGVRLTEVSVKRESTVLSMIKLRQREKLAFQPLDCLAAEP